jgi:hypothetical protein
LQTAALSDFLKCLLVTGVGAELLNLLDHAHPQPGLHRA